MGSEDTAGLRNIRASRSSEMLDAIVMRAPRGPRCSVRLWLDKGRMQPLPSRWQDSLTHDRLHGSRADDLRLGMPERNRRTCVKPWSKRTNRGHGSCAEIAALFGIGETSVSRLLRLNVSVTM